IVVMFADAGLQSTAITQLSGVSSERGQVFGQFVLAKLFLLIVAGILLIAWAAVARPASPFLFVGAWLAIRCMLQSFAQLQMASLKAISRAASVGIIQICHSAFLFVGLTLAYQWSWNLSSLLAWLVAAQFLELVAATIVLLRCGVYPQWPRNR